MIFQTYAGWEAFCRFLNERALYSVTIDEAMTIEGRFLALKHDVENSVDKALRVARIEAKYNQKATYYVQAYLLDSEKNVEMLREIHALGHLVSYHYDVLDAAGGDFEKAESIFRNELASFERNGFVFKSVCQHGNPLVRREGYTSNRDFFRNETIRTAYGLYDVMVNLRDHMKTKDYVYISDYGFSLRIVDDPEHADLKKTSDETIDWERLKRIVSTQSVIVSTHPHRFYRNLTEAYVRYTIFTILKKTAKALSRVPIVKRAIYANYHLAKRV